MKDNEFVKKQIQSLNRHLPKGRISLEEFLEQEKPQIESKDGTNHRIKKKELEYLSEILPEEMHSKLKLPIIIRISPELGRGASKISGKPEQKIVREILEKENETEKNELILYRPEVREIRKKLPTTTQYAFMISKRNKTKHNSRY